MTENSVSKKYDPVSAAYAAAQFMQPDPADWLERAGRAGMRCYVSESGGLCRMYVHGADLEHDADQDQVVFLECWLNLSPGASEAVVALLKKRGH
jgi:hypothetical protein